MTNLKKLAVKLRDMDDYRQVRAALEILSSVSEQGETRMSGQPEEAFEIYWKSRLSSSERLSIRSSGSSMPTRNPLI